MWPDVTDYSNYHGYNLMYVPDLHSALVHYGWYQSSSGEWCGSKGQVCVYVSLVYECVVYECVRVIFMCV